MNLSLACLVVVTVLSCIVVSPVRSEDRQPAQSDSLDLQKRIEPIPATAIFSDPGYDVWCGAMIRGDDGKCHLFYSRWPRELTHQAWVTHSQVAHAVSDSPFGPFKPTGAILPARGAQFWDGLCTHNPTVIRANGKYYLYYMGDTGDGVVRHPLNWVHRNNQRIGVAVADKPEGPWQRFDKPLIDVSDDVNAPDALMVSNPAVCQRPDGGFLMIYKGVGKQRKGVFGGPVVHLAATSDSPTGPFTKRLQPIFTKAGVDFPAEDPFIWFAKDGYWAIVKDNSGYFTGAGYSLALFQSADGFDWHPAKHVLVTSPKLLRWVDGKERTLTALERPQLYFEQGQPVALLCAAADRKDRDGSFNIQIPLRAEK
ncbi:MAG TPA: glycoside hydrolase family protein [Tepidisphaeraceae bacterium]|nr:glycoside hydrolase family protein [Tepidisphaeraceae bacterium]